MHTPRESQDAGQPSSIASAQRNSVGHPESSSNGEAEKELKDHHEDNTDIISPAPASGTDSKVATEGLFAATSNDTPNKNEVVRTSSRGPYANVDAADAFTVDTYRPDPYDFGRHRRDNVSKKQMAIEHPKGNKRKLKKFYNRQNELIDQFLGAEDEERQQVAEDARMGPKIKFAVNASFTVNFCLFVIQLYAAVSTGSLSLFATAADAFMDLVSSFVMLITSRMAAKPSIYKYPVGRTRIETIGIILFCALMTTVAIQLLVESGRSLAEGQRASQQLHVVPIVIVGVAIFAKGSLMVYCFAYRKYPSVHVFFIDHRNDIVVNSFGLVMSVVGDRFVWYLDPIGAICIALLILFSWVSNAFDQVWLLVGKSAPRDFVSKLIYMALTHDTRILKVDTCRAYHAGQKYYVEIDIVMDESTPLKISHDVAQDLQRKVEGLGDVERAFVHVDYSEAHDPHEEHKPLYERQSKKPRRTLKDILLRTKKDTAQVSETEISSGRSSA
ncbi:cation diffusion facilitator 1 (cation efflux family protein) [Colletotrichum tofieldiae]|uniref:Cation diffusion facilitator 1 (Cation efflux family protein) n=1 Tax=Colletotrichum tofieldiae TaxID=708197 RepID=A0A161VXQ3_9PEZI|nr:cation diffusion facilitator 1 (cation efflux family protein) [Colletotrichum tofieldiae]